MQSPPSYRFKISLRLRHPTADLSACTNEFGLAPFRQWTVGEARTSPRGKPLDGLWEDSYWTTPLDVQADEDLERALDRTAQWLAPHAPFLALHRASGGTTSLFIGLFLEGFNAGFALPPSLLAGYAALDVALELDLYDSPS